MASLQDQLLKAGLANEKQSKQATKSKKKQTRDVRKGVDVGETAAQRAFSEKQAQASRSKQLNAQRDAQHQDRAVIAQVKQMLERCRLDLTGGEVTYNFVDGKAIKKLYVNAMQQAALSRGSLVIVGLDDHYSVVPANVALRIEERAPDTFIIRAESAADTIADKDDPYADFVIPDDLMW
jgi:uncharacterized protein YaiL (DUF2058 family)|tara:strand:- start:2225 stop:2764 length:540 start_codon:yes stop_codon:yes gene_type:complete